MCRCVGVHPIESLRAGCHCHCNPYRTNLVNAIIHGNTLDYLFVAGTHDEGFERLRGYSDGYHNYDFMLSCVFGALRQ